MPSPIKTADAEAALRQILREQVDAARGNNQLVSRAESAALTPVLQQAEQELRAQGGPGTRVNADALVEKAAQKTTAAWASFQTSPRDALTLSQDELRQLKSADPALGALTELAILRVRGRALDPAAAVRAFFDGVDFSGRPVTLPGFSRLDARVGQADRSRLPAATRDAFDFFYRVEDRDIGSVRAHHGVVGGMPVHAIVTTTDGDNAYLEVRAQDGGLLAGARLHAGQVAAWDGFPGRVRLSNLFTSVLHEVKHEEGLSEELERADAGQPPQDWPGQARLDQGLVRYLDLSRFLDVDVPAGIAPELRDVATAAFEHLWESVSPRLGVAGEPFALGNTREGVLVVGEFTRPTDGKTYLVADWRDIDDGSYVLYFERTALGLKLAISQFDN